MTTRRDFLRKTSIALAGGLIVGDAALEAFERLTHRKVFALGGLPRGPMPLLVDVTYAPWSATINDSRVTLEGMQRVVKRMSANAMQWNFRVTPLSPEGFKVERV